jgi:hypothetical protein
MHLFTKVNRDAAGYRRLDRTIAPAAVKLRRALTTRRTTCAAVASSSHKNRRLALHLGPTAGLGATAAAEAV